VQKLQENQKLNNYCGYLFIYFILLQNKLDKVVKVDGSKNAGKKGFGASPRRCGDFYGLFSKNKQFFS